MPLDDEPLLATRVYLVVGALQALAVEQLAKIECYDRTVCINASDMALDLPARVSVLQATRGGILGALRYRRIIATLRRLRRVSRRLDVAIPHPYHALGNFMAFGLESDAIDLLPDGFLNYCRREVSERESALMYRKRLSMRLLGADYRHYVGLLDGSDRIGYRKAFTYRAHGMVSRAKTLEALSMIERPNGRHHGGRGVLFVDQPVLARHSQSAERIRGLLRNELLQADEIFLKPHPSGAKVSYLPAGVDVTLLDGREAVERLVGKLQVGTVIGVGSSSLMTIKLMYPAIRCIAIGLHHLAEEQPELLALLSLLEECDVEVRA